MSAKRIGCASRLVCRVFAVTMVFGILLASSQFQTDRTAGTLSLYQTNTHKGSYKPFTYVDSVKAPVLEAFVLLARVVE